MSITSDALESAARRRVVRIEAPTLREAKDEARDLIDASYGWHLERVHVSHGGITITLRGDLE